MFDFLKRRNIDPKTELRKVLGEYELPTYPVIVQQVLEKNRDPNASAQDVAEILSGDPGLSVKIPISTERIS
jgi:HD-like signal output (HDOD) protein